jgi:cytoskeletal protein CcmA (bactofilin family)
MSIFRRDSPSSPSASPSSQPPGAVPGKPSDPAAASRDARVTRIAPGTRVEGKVSGAAELLVEGEVDGEIQVEAPVVVGPGGVVRGPIAASVVRVAGKVFGDVRGADRVEVGAAGSLEGDIAAPRVVLAEGSFFKGKVEMQGDKAKGERSSSGAAAEGPRGD